MSQWRDDTQTATACPAPGDHQPGPERDALLLLVKAAIATVLAWQFAVRVLDSPVPFYAPMAALLVVDRTMVRSLSASAQRIAAVVLGLSVAWVVATVFGVTWWTMFGVILVALVIGRWSRLGDHGIQVPAMVLLSLITAGGMDEHFTYLTIVETVAGGVIGVATNAIVLAPLHLTKPRQRVSALARQVRSCSRRWPTGCAATGTRRPPAVVPPRRRDRRQGAVRRRRHPHRVARACASTCATTSVPPTSTGTATSAPSRRCVGPSGRSRASGARSSTPRTSGVASRRPPSDVPRGVRRRPRRRWPGRVAAGPTRRRRDDGPFDEGDGRGLARSSTTLSEQVRTTPLEDPEQWPVYGSLISDSLRAVASSSRPATPRRCPAAQARSGCRPARRASGRGCVFPGWTAGRRERADRPERAARVTPRGAPSFSGHADDGCASGTGQRARSVGHGTQAREVTSERSGARVDTTPPRARDHGRCAVSRDPGWACWLWPAAQHRRWMLLASAAPTDCGRRRQRRLRASGCGRVGGGREHEPRPPA